MLEQTISDEDLQRSYTDHEDNTNLLFRTHLQLPDHRQRKEEDDDVFYNAKPSTGKSNDSRHWKTFCICDCLVPDGADGQALEYDKKEENKAMYELGHLSPLQTNATDWDYVP